MINPRYFLLLILFFGSASSQASLIFSEYVEGSSYNKALELFNTGVAVDFDAGNYAIEIYSNGSSDSGYTISLSGVVLQNSTFVIGHSNANTAISSMANMLTTSLNFNGDDAIRLVANGETVDRIGQIGVDPGVEWGSGLVSTQNNTLRRQADLASGDIHALDIFDPSLQWLGFETDTFNGLGAHVMDSPVSLPVADKPSTVSVPEPPSVLLLMLGLLSILLKRSKNNHIWAVCQEKPC